MLEHSAPEDNSDVFKDNDVDNLSQPAEDIDFYVTDDDSVRECDITRVDIPRKGLKMLHLNVHYLESKLPLLKVQLDSFKSPIQILGFSETFLTENTRDSALYLDGYSIHRRDRQGKGGGGVLVYVADNIAAIRRSDLEHPLVECVWLEVKPKGCKAFLLCNIYRPPDAKDDWLSTFENVLINASKDQVELVLMGDFNVDLCQGERVSKLVDITESFQLTQVIDEPTRITQSSQTLIDHIYVTDLNKIVDSKVVQWDLSDHFAILAIHHNKCSKESDSQHKVISFRSMKQFDKDSFLNDLMTVPWEIVTQSSDPEEALSTWYELFLTVLDKHAPVKTKRVKKWHQADWITQDILEAIKKRKDLRKKKQFKAYRKQRNLVKAMMKKAKTEYYNSLLSDNSKGTNQVWKCIKKLDPNQKYSSAPLSYKG